MGLKNDAMKEETAVESKKPRGNNHLVLRGKTKFSIPNLHREEGLGSCTLELLVPNIPKHITTSDEKYVLRCLEAIHNYAIQNSSGWNSSRTRISPVDCISIDDQHQGVARFTSVVSISGSQSMQNILNSPLLKQFGSSSDSNPGDDPMIHFGSRSPTLRCSYLLSSHGTLTDFKPVSVSSHKRAGSVSSMASSTFSGKSSSASSFEGTLQCTWKDGLPHHVFSVEDKREMYRAEASKVVDDEAQCCYVYTFYAGKQGRKDRNAPEMETVATMRVSTSVTVCSSSGNEIAETRFILYAPSEVVAVHSEETNSYKKSENLSRKVASFFRPSSSSTQQQRARNPVAWNIHEIAAVVLKEVRENPRNAGGWGLKFLKKSSGASSKKVESTRNDGGECSTSMNVLIPAGIHGGTKRPSPLVERWTSGGVCDCGGWDVGCPLTVLVPAEIPEDGFSANRRPPPVNLFLQGYRGGGGESPVLSMANVGEDGLCNVRFEATLSSLQCFGIAVAVFHSQNHHRLL